MDLSGLVGANASARQISPKGQRVARADTQHVIVRVVANHGAGSRGVGRRGTGLQHMTRRESGISVFTVSENEEKKQCILDYSALSI